MVTFACDRCSESLKKVAVHKHLWRCKSTSFTCIDCQQVFDNQTFTTHTKCMTEEQRYQGKLYVPKESQDKGQKKQDNWIENIIKYINDGHGGKETQFLQVISKHPNIPRKKPKFINFTKTVLRLHDPTKIEAVWNHVTKANEMGKEVAKKEEEASANVKTSNPDSEHATETDRAQNDTNASKPTGDGPVRKKMKTQKEEEVKKTEQVSSEPSEEECPSQDEEVKGDENEDKNAVAEDSQSKNVKKNAKKRKEKVEKYRWKTQIISILSEMGAMTLRKMQSRLYIRYKKQVDPEKQEDKETVYSRIKQATEKSSKVTFTPENNMVTLNKSSSKDED